MIAVTKIEDTVISMHVYDDGKIVVAQVDPDSGQDYTYRQHFTDYPMAHAAFSTLVTERLERERAEAEAATSTPPAPTPARICWPG